VLFLRDVQNWISEYAVVLLIAPKLILIALNINGVHGESRNERMS